MFLLETLRGKLFPWLFQRLEAVFIPWLMIHLPRFSPLKPASTLQQTLLPSSHLPLCAWYTLFCLTVPPVRTHDYIGPIQIIQIMSPLECQLISNFNSICIINYSFPCNLTYSMVPGIRIWTSVGVHSSAYHIAILGPLLKVYDDYLDASLLGVYFSFLFSQSLRKGLISHGY